MFERFTAKARRVVVIAQEEARLLSHNYIGTEHLLLGLIHEGSGVGGRVLSDFEMTLEGTRQEVEGIVGRGSQQISGHIPFTPRAKKTLELALREALTLHHNYIGTEHILLGLIREGEGMAAQIMRSHADLLKIRAAILDLVPADTSPLQSPRARSWLRRVVAGIPFAGEPSGPQEGPEQPRLNATPAADVSLSIAAKLAGGEPVGSHHLLLAALTDANSAAAKVLASLGVDLTRAKDALRDADVAGTSDEPPEEAGRRQLNITVTGELVTVVAADRVLVATANAALKALREARGADAAPGGVIAGADLAGSAARNLAKAWEALAESLSALAGQAALEAERSEASKQAGDPPQAAPGDAAGADG